VGGTDGSAKGGGGVGQLFDGCFPTSENTGIRLDLFDLHSTHAGPTWRHPHSYPQNLYTESHRNEISEIKYSFCGKASKFQQSFCRNSEI
jgi:hypothetical protein